MKKSILIAIAVVAIIVIFAGVFIAYNPFAVQPAATPTPPPSGTVDSETARDAAIMYIATNHTDITSMLSNLNWTGGKVETGLVGSEKYTWISGNWNVTVTNPVVLDPVYTVGAFYNDEVNKVSINWDGTYQNGVVTETNYSFVVP